jgi:hypothetical protein
VHRGDPEIVQLLQREGAVLDPGAAKRLACVAAARGRREIAALLGGGEECPQ